MAMSGTYVTDVPLKGSAEKNYKRWKNEPNFVDDVVGHHMDGLTIQEGDWDPLGAILLWYYIIDGKARIEMDDENTTVTVGLEGHLTDVLKVYQMTFQFIGLSEEGCVCKITMVWEKLKEDYPEPINFMKFAEKVIAGMDDDIISYDLDF